MTLRVYTGLDARDADALRVFKASLLKHSSIPVDIRVLKDWELRSAGHYFRPYHVDPGGQKWDMRDGRPFSTAFSFTRFCVPMLEGFGEDWVLWADPDMLWRADIADLVSLIDPDMAAMVVKHDYSPPESEKMVGLRQWQYARKNWSSLMLLRPDRCEQLSRYTVNSMDREWLHAMFWLPDDMIGGLPECWNHLVGWSDPAADPKVVHFTRGTPDLAGYENEPFADEWRSYL